MPDTLTISQVAARARLRDVPRDCICGWEWNPQLARWIRDGGPAACCPWHGGSW